MRDSILTEEWIFDGKGGATCKRYIDDVFLDEQVYVESPIVLVRNVMRIPELDKQRLIDSVKNR